MGCGRGRERLQASSALRAGTRHGEVGSVLRELYFKRHRKCYLAGSSLPHPVNIPSNRLRVTHCKKLSIFCSAMATCCLGSLILTLPLPGWV